MAQADGFDSRACRDTIGQFSTGVVVVGEVLGFETLREDALPLLYFRGGYGVS